MGLFDGLKSALGLGGDESTTTLGPARNSGLAPNKPANMRNLMSSANSKMKNNSTMASLAPAPGPATTAASTNSMAGGARKKYHMKKYKMKRAVSRKNRRAASRKNRRATRKNRK